MGDRVVGSVGGGEGGEEKRSMNLKVPCGIT